MCVSVSEEYSQIFSNIYFLLKGNSEDFKVQGKTPRDAVHLISDAKDIVAAGAYAVVLELIPTALSHMITQRISVPTIGIGAGPFCSGQVQVLHDILGLFINFQPKHAKKFHDVGEDILIELLEYRNQVENRIFPSAKESFYMDDHALDLIRSQLPVLDENLSTVARILAEQDYQLIAKASEVTDVFNS